MKKMILALCAVATLSIAVISCSKKEDSSDSTTTTTTTTATTSTTATTGTTGTPVRPTATKNTLVVDTNIIGYTVSNCGSVGQGRWVIEAGQTTKLNNKFTATFSTQPNFSRDFTITTGLPTSNSQVQLTALFDTLLYVASSGTASFSKGVDTTLIKFKDIKFSVSGHPDILVSGFMQCQ